MYKTRKELKQAILNTKQWNPKGDPEVDTITPLQFIIEEYAYEKIEFEEEYENWNFLKNDGIVNDLIDFIYNSKIDKQKWSHPCFCDFEENKKYYPEGYDIFYNIPEEYYINTYHGLLEYLEKYPRSLRCIPSWWINKEIFID